ncbi:hypothetical protein LLG96_20140 [bacterium]|nr:hypothetical protein [bacterium]
MVRRILSIVLCGEVFLLLYAGCSSTKIEKTRSDTITIPSTGIKQLNLDNLAFVSLTYNGSPDADRFDMNIKLKVTAGDEETCSDLLSNIVFETETVGEKAVIRLKHPKIESRGIKNWLFNPEKWEITITMSGPQIIDMDMNADFSHIRTDSTSGKLAINTDFSESEVRNHVGRLTVNADFCKIIAKELDGGFTVNSDFSKIMIELSRLTEDSRASIDFGKVDIGVPPTANADFFATKSFGKVSFNVGGDASNDENCAGHHILNGGGPRVDLNVEFGDIAVWDNFNPTVHSCN